MKVAIAFALFVSFCLAENDIYLGGNFLLSLQQDDGNLNHIASLIGYNVDTDEFQDVFDGGVFKEDGFINVLEETPNGMYGAGVFRYMDDDYDYSNSVLKYNNDDDDFESVKDGIFLRNGDSILFIAGTNDYTYFAGKFDAVEYLSEQDDDSVYVPNIVRINSDDEWELLDNSDEVFPSDPQISGVAAFEDTLFIYASGALYSYSDDEYVLLSTEDLFEQTPIVVDDAGNIGGVQFAGSDPFGSGVYSFVFFNAEEEYSASVTDLYTYNAATTSCVDSYPHLIAWNGGFLLSSPDMDTNCTSSSWIFFNSTVNQMVDDYSEIPDVTGDIDEIVVGENNDLWLASYSNSILGYLPSGGPQWIDVDLAYFGSFTVYVMAFDSDEEKLMVYGYTSKYGMQFIEVVPDALPPIVKQKSPGVLVTPGIVNALAVMNDPDDDDYELYIGGRFDGVGSGHTYANLARYKDGDFDQPIPNMPEIQCLASHESTIFYATNACPDNGQTLQLGYYSKNTAELDVWTTLPVVIGASGCVTALDVDDRYIFVGGDFSVTLPDGTDAHAVIYFDREDGEWKDIGIPTTIASTGYGYEINTLRANQIDDVYYLAIGGRFDVTINQQTYHSFAVYNLNTNSWFDVLEEFDTDTIVYDLIIDEISSIYIAGDLNLLSGGNEKGAFSYNVEENQYRTIGNLPATARSIILNTDEDDQTNIYGGGSFTNGTNHLGMAYTDVESSPNVDWTRGATNQFLQYYLGDVTVMVYATGGKGANDTNGNDPTYSAPDTGDSGMSGWGVFFLVLFVLLLVLAIVGAGAGGGYYFYNKRKNYQEL